MIPTAIPDAEVFELGRRIVIGPPPGHDVTGDIRAVESVAWEHDGTRRYSMRLELEPGELSLLQDRVPVWLTFLGSIPPFNVTVGPPVGFIEGTDPARSKADWQAQALNEAADAIQALHPNEVKASVTFLRERALAIQQTDSTN